MIVLITEIIGWIATVFRSAGMLVTSAERVKVLVSIGNAFWLVNGLLTHNLPLIASNAICLLIMMVDIIKEKVKKRRYETLD